MSNKITRLEAIREQRVMKPSNRALLGRHRVRSLIARGLRNNPLQLLWLDRGKRYLNVGCGGNVIADFVNIDYRWVRGQDLCWDILRGIPLPDHSMQGIFIEHVLEHFTWEDARNVLLPEFLRLLSPGGTLRISVPDGRKAVEEYNHAIRQGLVDIAFIEKGSRSLTPMMRLNDTFRQIFEPPEFGHKFAYDFQTLELFLRRTGFTHIRRESYMSGRDATLLVDYKRRAEESLYVEACAPDVRTAESPVL